MKSAVDNPVEATKTGMLRAKFTTAPARSDGRRMSQQIMEMDGSAAPGEERRRMLDMLRKIRHEHAMHLDEERAKYGGIVADLSATTHTQNSMLRRSRAQQAELKKELRKAARKEEMLESTAGALQKKMRSARQAQASMQIHAEEKHMELEKVRADATRLRTLLAKTESPTGSPSTGAAKDGGRTSPGSGGRRPITAPSNARRQRSRGGGEGRSGGGRGGGRGGESGAGARPQTSSASSGGRRSQRDRGERPRTAGAPTAAGSEEAAAAGGVATAPAGEEGNQVMFFDDGAAVEPTTGSALETKGEPRGGAGGEVGTGGAQGPSSESTNSRFKSAARRVVAANRSNKVEGGPVGGDASTSRELFPPEEVEAAASGDGAGGDDDGGDGGVSLAVALSGQTGPEAMKDANGNEMSHEEQNKRAKAAAAITGGSAKAKPSAAAPRMMPLRKYKLPALTDKAKILEQEKCLKLWSFSKRWASMLRLQGFAHPSRVSSFACDRKQLWRLHVVINIVLGLACGLAYALFSAPRIGYAAALGQLCLVWACLSAYVAGVRAWNTGDIVAQHGDLICFRMFGPEGAAEMLKPEFAISHTGHNPIELHFRKSLILYQVLPLAVELAVHFGNLAASDLFLKASFFDYVFALAGAGGTVYCCRLYFHFIAVLGFVAQLLQWHVDQYMHLLEGGELSVKRAYTLYFALAELVDRFNTIYTRRALVSMSAPLLGGLVVSYANAVSSHTDDPVSAAPRPLVVVMYLVHALCFLGLWILPWTLCAGVTQSCRDIPKRAMAMYAKQDMLQPLFERSYDKKVPGPREMDQLVMGRLNTITDKLQLSLRYQTQSFDFARFITTERPGSAFTFSVSGWPATAFPALVLSVAVASLVAVAGVDLAESALPDLAAVVGAAVNGGAGKNASSGAGGSVVPA